MGPVFMSHPNGFPIRHDAICLVRHDNAVAVVCFKKVEWFHARYVVGYWAKNGDFARTPPDSINSGTVKNIGYPEVRVGPWNLRCSLGSENMLWLYRPDSTYQVEAFTADAFPGDLSWAENSPVPRKGGVNTP